MTRPGDLRDQAKFERRSPAGTNVGGVIKAGWAPLVAYVRAKVFPLRGGETVRAARLSGAEVYEVTVRGSAEIFGVTTADRCIVRLFRPGGSQEVTLAIRSIVNPDRRGNWVQFLCDTGAPDGD